MTKKDFNKQMRYIGEYVVSIYGAVLERWKIDNKTGNIVLYANEHGEKFTCDISPLQWSLYASECGAI